MKKIKKNEKPVTTVLGNGWTKKVEGGRVTLVRTARIV